MAEGLALVLFLAIHVSALALAGVLLWREGRNAAFRSSFALVGCLVAAKAFLRSAEVDSFTHYSILSLTGIKDFILASAGLLAASRLRIRPFALAGGQARTSITSAFVVVVTFAIGVLLLSVFVLDARISPLLQPVELRRLAFAGLVVPFGEELVYRLGIQNVFAAFLPRDRWSYSVAILASAIGFALGHYDASLRFAQVLYAFVAAVVLGIVFRRFGFEAAVASHACANLLLLASLEPGPGPPLP